MKNLLTTAALLALVLSPPAHAADAASSARTASAPRATTATSTAAGANSTTAASAPRAASQPASQQSRMKQCNEKAAGMKGDERRALMKECLSTKTGDAKAGSTAVAGAKDAKETKQAQGTSSGPETQQSRMKTCNADAKGKSGDERRAFMKQCLSNKPA